MSGPKTSRYVLTAEQRRRLEEQQRIIRETKAAQDRNSNLKRNCKNYIADLDPIIIELERISKESGYETETVLYLKQRRSEIITALSQVISSEDLKSIQVTNEKLDKVLHEIHSLTSKGKVSINSASAAYRNELADVIVGGFSLSFAGLGSKRKLKENPFVIKINDALQKIESLILSSQLREKFEVLKTRAQEIKSIDFLENFCSMQVYPFVHECEFYRDHIEEYEILLSQYLYLTAEVGEPAKVFVFSESSLIKLKEEITRLDQIVICQKEQEYISRAADEAMLEMGYKLVGERSVTKRSGKKFRNGLYALEAGTAVNVTFSDSGQISMELGALDITDRTPTEAEATELADDMRAFCDDYAKLEKKLAEKGITTRRISILPPSVEYAQVFNTNDYELKRPLETYRKEKRKATVGKQRHSEG